MITITAKIYLESVGVIDIGRQNILDLSISSFEKSDIKLPSYGIVSNTGHLSFNDYDNRIRKYAETLAINNKTTAKIFLNNTITKRQEQIAFLNANEWEYDNINRTVSVSLKDDLEEWQNIQIEAINYDPRNPKKVFSTFKDLYNWLYDRTPNKYKMLTFNELDAPTQQVLLYLITYPILESGTLWQQWTKMCDATGSYIYKNKENRTVFVHTNGS
jgi:hypothetical protein